MLRRSRISVRPNVRPAGRGPPSSQDAPEPPAADPQASVDPNQTEVKNTATPTEPEKPSETPREDGEDQNGEASSSGTTSTAGPQRRKRFSVMPNLAKPRAAPTLTRSSSRTPRSPVKAVSETPTLLSEDPEAPRQTDTTVQQGLRSPSRRRPSGGGKQPRAQSKPSHLYPSSPASAAALLETEVSEDSCPSQLAPQSADQQMTSSQFTKSDKGSLQSDPTSVTSKQPQIKETPPTPLEKVPPSLPGKEASEISERAKTLASRAGMSGLSLVPGKSRLSRLLNDPTDLQRLAKARKLRELLRQEMSKERKLKKAKIAMKEYTVDHSKMTMRDLIYYLPDSNPMASYLEEERKEMEIVVPPTPPREESPERAQEPEVNEPVTQREEEEEEEADGNEGDGDAAQDDQMMVPRVKVAEDGSLIIDEESLTVEVLRVKGPNPADDGDPIFERGSTTTYSSFRKGTYTKPWSNQETDMFFLAISMVGTDFSMIGQLFPHRARTEIKNKFKKEERANAWRIDKAFKEKRRLDLEFFTKLLEKILAVEKKKRKKNKSPNEKKAVMKHKSKPKEKKAVKKLSDVEEEEEEEDDDVAELDREEVEGEKENEDLSNEGAKAPTTPKSKRRKKDGGGEESSPEKDKDKKKKKKNKQTSEQDEATVPADSEAVVPEDQSSVDGSEKTDGSVKIAKGPVIKPAQLSRGRVQMHIPNLGRRFGQKGPQPLHKPRDGARKTGEDSTEEGTEQEQVGTDESPSELSKDQKQTADVISSEEEDEPSVAPAKPTRYGRVPKPIQHLNYPAKEVDSPPASGSDLPEGSPSSSTKPKPKPKPKLSARRGKHKPDPALPQRKGHSGPEKAKLVTLRASLSDEEEDEEQREEAQAEEDHYHPTSPEKENQAPAFVPLSLRSPQPVAFEVEETMEELDISVNVPDVLGISHHALCPDASCKQAQGEVGSVPCEHQLDLLVDVIDFLSPEHMEVSEESYTEAARTLLAIGNLAHLSQSTQDYSSEAQVIIDEEPSYQDQSKSSAALPETMYFGSVVTEATQPAEELITMTDSVPVPQTSDLSTADITSTEEWSTSLEEKTSVEAASQVEPGSEGSEQTVPQTRKSRFSKPKPNLEPATRTTQSMSQPPESSITQSEPQPTDRTVTQPEPLQSAQNKEQPSLLKSASAPTLVPESLRSSEEVRGHDGSKERLSEEGEREESVKEVQKSEDEKRAGDSQSGPSDSDQATKTALQTRRTRISKPKPNLRRATRTTQSKPQPTDDTITQAEPQHPDNTDIQSEPQTFESTTTQPEPPQSAQSEEQPSPLKTAAAPTSALVSLRSSAEVKGHDGSEERSPEEKESVESDKVEESEEKCVGDSQSGPSDSDQTTKMALKTRRSRISKPKPNLGRATRTTQSKPQPTDDTITQAEPQPTDNTDMQSEPQTFKSTTTQPEPPQSAQSKEQPSPLKTAAAPTSASVSLRSSEEVKGHDGSKECLSEERVRAESDKVEKSEDEKRAGDSHSGPSDLDQPTKTTPQTRRTRFPKPKPNLGRVPRASSSKSGQTTTQPEPVANTETLEDSAAQKADISTITEAHRPLGGADVHIERELTHNESLSSDKNPPPINLTRTFDDTALLYAAPCAEQSQTEPIITQHSEDLAPTDPDEPIFILSLTEIPIVPMGEEFGCVSEPFSYTFSTLQSSDIPEAGGSLAIGNAELLCNIPVVPISVEVEGDEGGGGFTSIKDVEPALTAGTSQNKVRSVDPHEGGTTKPSENLMTERTSEEEDPPHKKRKLQERGRRAKLQLKPNTAVRKQPSRTAPAEEALCTSTSAPDSPQPGATDTAAASGELAAEVPHEGIVGCRDPPEAKKGTPTGGDETEGCSSGVESQVVHHITPLATSIPLSRPGRRPRGFLSFISNKSNPAPPGGPRGAKPVPQRPQVNTLHTDRKRPAPAPTTSRTSALPEPVSAPITPRTSGPPVALASESTDVDPEPSTSQCTTTNEEPSAQKVQFPCGDHNSADEGPLNVSQYFFSDIFTEVEESEG